MVNAALTLMAVRYSGSSLSTLQLILNRNLQMHTRIISYLIRASDFHPVISVLCSCFTGIRRIRAVYGGKFSKAIDIQTFLCTRPTPSPDFCCGVKVLSCILLCLSLLCSTLKSAYSLKSSSGIISFILKNPIFRPYIYSIWPQEQVVIPPSWLYHFFLSQRSSLK